MEKKTTNSCIVCGYCNDPSVSFFTFPKDPDRRREWMRSLQLPESLDLFYRRVCSKHFSREDFVKCGNTGRRMLLKKTSLPRLNTSKEDLPLKKTLNYFAKFGRLRKNRRLAHSCYICGANRDEAASYFKFPSEPSTKFFWLEACCINADSTVDNLFLCNKHFLHNDFIENEKQLLLKRNAIPTQFMEPPNDFKNTHSCIICGTSQSERLSYFGLPKTEEMKLLWEKACGFQIPKIDCQYRICSKHFVADDFTNDPKAAKRLRLKKTTVPSLHLNVQRKSAVKKECNVEKFRILEMPEYALISEDKYSVSVPVAHFVELPVPVTVIDERFVAEEIIEDKEYSVIEDSVSFDNCIEEIVARVPETSSETNQCIRLQRELILKQQKDIEALQQQLREARQKNRILEQLGVQLHEVNKGTDNATVYVRVA